MTALSENGSTHVGFQFDRDQKDVEGLGGGGGGYDWIKEQKHITINPLDATAVRILKTV